MVSRQLLLLIKFKENRELNTEYFDGKLINIFFLINIDKNESSTPFLISLINIIVIEIN